MKENTFTFTDEEWSLLADTARKGLDVMYKEYDSVRGLINSSYEGKIKPTVSLYEDYAVEVEKDIESVSKIIGIINRGLVDSLIGDI